MPLNERMAQQGYYRDTAENYDKMHLAHNDEHYFALNFILGMFDFLDVKSVLDIGSGTGRAIEFIKNKRPDITIVGIEPVDELREVGYSKGLSREELIGGNGASLPYDDNEFDLVTEFSVLHHVRRPESVVAEMLRVANKAIFISDDNIWGDSSLAVRFIKASLQKLRLWKLSVFFKTRGKGYTDTEIDGISYYYSVFDSFRQIQGACSSVHYINTNIRTGLNENLYRSATHVGLLGMLQPPCGPIS